MVVRGLLVLASLSLVVDAGDASDALAFDDECVGEGCSVGLLQLRGSKDAGSPPENSPGGDHAYNSSDSMEGVPPLPGSPAAALEKMQKADKADKKPNSPGGDHTYHGNDGMEGVPPLPGSPAAENAAARVTAQKADAIGAPKNIAAADHIYYSSDGMEGVPDANATQKKHRKKHHGRHRHFARYRRHRRHHYPHWDFMPPPPLRPWSAYMMPEPMDFAPMDDFAPMEDDVPREEYFPIEAHLPIEEFPPMEDFPPEAPLEDVWEPMMRLPRWRPRRREIDFGIVVEEEFHGPGSKDNYRRVMWW